ncbi:MAG: insect kinin peptide [Gemmatimonadetes bacterium]|nr:insect kinin peptide [Gemmatimonadota bacterium]
MTIHRSSRRTRASRLPLSLLSLAALLASAAPAAAQCLNSASTCVKPAPGEQASAVVGSTTLSLFVRGTDNAVWVATRPASEGTDSPNWSAWVSLGGSVASGPAASTRGDRSDNMDVFARGASGHLMHIWRIAGAWSSWEDLGGALTSAPASVSTTPNNVDVFARGADNGLAHRAWGAGGVWQAWEKIPGGILTSAPVVATMTSGSMHVFAAGTNTHMYHVWKTGAAWSSWEDLGCCIVGAPAVAALGSAQLLTLGRGTNNALYAQGFTGRWSGWSAQVNSGVLSSSPALVSYVNGANRVSYAIALGTDAALYQTASTGGAWADWLRIGVARSVAAGSSCGAGRTSIPLGNGEVICKKAPPTPTILASAYTAGQRQESAACTDYNAAVSARNIAWSQRATALQDLATAQRLLDHSAPGQKAVNQSRVDDAQKWVDTHQKEIDTAESRGETAHGGIAAAIVVEKQERSVSLECINWFLVYAAR